MQTEFRVEVRGESGSTVLALFGELDVASSHVLEAELQRVTASGLTVIDLRNLEFIDSTGLGVLVKAHQLALREDREVGLVKADGQVQRLLALTGLAEQLPVADSVEELLDRS